MYQALYRKYRPTTFDDVIGQEHITDSLKAQVESGHLSHAYIFIGTRGTGKTTCARILAKAVNCENPVNGNPCCKCDSCRGIADGSIMDIVELDAASNNGVDNVRALREEAVFSPANVKKRVYIIDEVHMLSTAAFNALLKILEEPPEHLMFILATTELQKVPATILSRCQRHSFRRIENEELSRYLLNISSKENLGLTAEAATVISGLAEGSVRDALSMLDQCSAYEKIDVDAVYSSVGLAGNLRTMSLFEKIMDKDAVEAIEDLNSLWFDGKDVSCVMKELSSLTRDVLIMKMAPKSASKLIYGGYGTDRIKAYAEAYEEGRLLAVLNGLQKTGDGIKDNISPKVKAELCIINLCLDNFMTEIPAASAMAPKTVIKSANIVPSAKQEPVETKEVPQKENISVPEEINRNMPDDKILQKEEIKKVAVSQDDEWEAIKEALKPNLPFDLRATLSGIGGSIDGIFLNICVPSEFLFGRINKPDIIAVIEKTAKEITGKDLKTKIVQGEVRHDKPARSLDELKSFEEINWR